MPAGLDPERDHVVVADCNPLPEEFNPDYDLAPFDVTGGGSTSTPPTTEPTVDDEPDGEPPVAPPAVPVEADPTFAG